MRTEQTRVRVCQAFIAIWISLTKCFFIWPFIKGNSHKFSIQTMNMKCFLLNKWTEFLLIISQQINSPQIIPLITLIQMKTEMFYLKNSHGSWFMGFTYMRKYGNPINHEPKVKFQFLKLFWNPFNMFKPSYFVNFYDKTHIHFFFKSLF